MACFQRDFIVGSQLHSNGVVVEVPMKRFCLSRIGHASNTVLLVLLTAGVFSSAWSAPRDSGDHFLRRLDVLLGQGQRAEVCSLLQENYAHADHVAPGASIEVAADLEKMAAAYETSRENSLPHSDHEIARLILLNALKVRQESAGLHDVSLIRLLNRIGDTFNKSARHQDSVEFHERSLAIAESVHGENHPATLHQLNRLADTYRNLADYPMALELFGRALAIQEQRNGVKSVAAIHAREQIALTLMRMGNATAAIESYDQVLVLYESLPGDFQEAVAGTRARLGDLYTLTNHYPKAKEVLEKSMAFFEKRYGPDCSHLGNIKSMLANVYGAVGDAETALALDQQSVSILSKTLGPDHPLTAHRLDNLGLRYDALGDFEKGRECHERALPVIEKAYGSEHSSTVHVLANCAESLLQVGEIDKAKQHLERVIQVRRKVLGPRHSRIADSLCILAAAYGSEGDSAKVRELSLQALSIYEEALPSNSPHIASHLNNMARTDAAAGNFAIARQRHERALAILDAVYGPQHIVTGMTHLWLAELHYLEGRLPLARSHAARAVASFEHEMNSALLSDERTRLEMLEDFQELDFLYGLLRPEQIAQLSLRWKGIVLDSLLEDRLMVRTFSKDKEAGRELEELKGLQAELSRIPHGKEHASRRESILSDIGDFQRKMAARTTVFGRVRSSSDLTIDAVLPALAGGGMLIDFLKFCDPKMQGDDSLFYGACLLTEEGVPVFVRIPDRVGIDRAVDDIHAALRSSNETLLKKTLGVLGEKLWKPIAAHVPTSVKRLVICPEGKLNFVSFATLPQDSGAFLCESYQVAYAATARDPAPVQSGVQHKSMVIFANPDFDNAGDGIVSNRLALRAAEVSAFRKVRLPPLPGSERESESLAKTAHSHGWNTNVFLGDQASERMMRSLQDVDILHLATHGFYLQPEGLAPAGSRAIHLEGKAEHDTPIAKQDGKVNPMRASGIALSGAQATFKAWREGDAPDPDNDGILTAEEVACLNLDRAWLVTLAACDTGMGEVRSGEGVFGLRRAFVQAGARNLLMTLWPVRDTSTAGVMADFYARCLSSGDPSGALALTQRDWLVKLRDEQGLLTAVRDAGAFVLSSHRAGSFPGTTDVRAK